MNGVRGIRGAITVERNETEQINEATRELLMTILQENDVQPQDVASCYITVTQDLDAAYPARAIRELSGWAYVPLLCAQEMHVIGSLPRCIRLLLHVNTTKGQQEIRHAFLRGARVLRPDLAEN
jgi:chorismate mutase